MSKDRGGYVMIYVLVVITLVAALSVSVCYVALRELQGQKTAVSQMQQLYAAEGRIEKTCAALRAGIVTGEGDSEAAAMEKANEAFKEYLEDVSADVQGGPTVYTVTLAEKAGDTLVTARVNVSVTAVNSFDGGKNKCQLYVSGIKYMSYVISAAADEGGGGEP